MVTQFGGRGSCATLRNKKKLWIAETLAGWGSAGLQEQLEPVAHTDRVPGLPSGPLFLSTSVGSKHRFLEKGFDWPILGHVITLDQLAVPSGVGPQQNMAAPKRTTRLKLWE